MVQTIGSNASSKVLTVICDHDGKNDVDDVAAFMYALALEKQGLFKIGGMVCCTSVYGMPAVYNALAARARRLPDGADTDLIIGSVPGGSGYLSLGAGIGSTGGLGVYPVTAKRFANLMRGNTSWMSDVRAYRRICANALPGTVVPTLHGNAFSIQNFLQSPADDISPLTGLQLATRAFAYVIFLGGYFNPIQTAAESDFSNSPAAWAYLFANITFCPIIDFGAEGYGPMGQSGPPLDADPGMDPYAKVFAYMGMTVGAAGAFTGTIAAGLLTVASVTSGYISGTSGPSTTADNSGNLFGQVLNITGVTTRNPIRIVGLVSGTKNTAGAVYSISDPTVSVASATAMTTKLQWAARGNVSHQIFDYIAFGVGPLTNLAYLATNCSVTMSSTTGVVSAFTPGAGNVNIICQPADTSWAACAPVTARFNATVDRLFETNTLPSFPAALDPKSHPSCVAALEPFNPALVSGTSGSTSLVIADPVSKGLWIVPASMGDSGNTAPTPTGPTVSTTSAGLNGLAVLNFDGVANCLAQDALAPIFSGAFQPLHFVMVTSVLAQTAAGSFIDIPILGATTGYNRIRFSQTAAGQLNLARGAAYQNFASGGTPTASAYHVFEGVYDPRWDPSCNLALLTDDTPLTSAQTGSAGNSVDLALARFRIAQSYVRATDSAASGVQINLAALYVYKAPVEMFDRDRIIRSIATRWALSGIPI